MINPADVNTFVAIENIMDNTEGFFKMLRALGDKPK